MQPTRQLNRRIAAALNLTVSCRSKLVASVTKPLAHRVASIVCDCSDVPLGLEWQEVRSVSTVTEPLCDVIRDAGGRFRMDRTTEENGVSSLEQRLMEGRFSALFQIFLEHLKILR